MAKTIVCRCEDVTVDDLQDAYDHGYWDLESIKRYSGFATGLCQGKCCTAHVARFVAEREGGDAIVDQPWRTRPLLCPVPVACFAGEEENESQDETLS
jgi:bacterioferritin-associated ferredoxin